MTADDARKLTAEATSLDGEKVRLVLGCWHGAIRKAAAAGGTSVRESQVDRPRTPIPSAAREAAYAQLRASGFTVRTVRTVQCDRNESETEVSWGPAAVRVPPTGGSGTAPPKSARPAAGS